MPEVPIETPALGFAEAPFGTAAFALGTPAEPGAAPAPSNGSRFLNPRTRDWEIDPDTSQHAQMPAARQRVLLALLTVRGSATSAPGFGFKPPSKIGPRFEAETRNAVRVALAHLTREDAPAIEIQDIAVQKIAPGRVLLTVSYVDLATGEEDEASI